MKKKQKGDPTIIPIETTRTKMLAKLPIVCVLIWAVLSVAVAYNGNDQGNTKKNKKAAEEWVKFQLPPHPAQIKNDYLTGSRVSKAWDLLANDVKSRIAFGLNDFHGKKEVMLGAFSHLTTASNQLTNINIKKVVGDGDNVVVYYEGLQVLPGYNYTATNTISFEFNKHGKIDTLYVDTYNIEWNLGPIDQPSFVIQTACNYALNYCNSTTDPSGHYTDMADCLAFMATIPIGNWGFLTTNSAHCRAFQGPNANLNPAEYCPSLGKTGAKYCVDRPATTFYPNNFL